MKGFERKMLLQHFFTYSDEVIQKSDFYKSYKEIESHKDSKNKIRMNDINKALLKFENYITSCGFGSSKSENWIEKSDFEQAMNFSLDNFWNIRLLKEVNHINDKFSIMWDEDKKEWRLGTPNNPFAGSKDKQKIEKLNETIKLCAQEINPLITEMNKHISEENSSIIVFHAGLMRVISLALDHGSTFAGCRKCLEYITDPILKKEYKKMLDDQEKENRFSWT